MRNRLTETLVQHARMQELVFLTGDLGYKTLEPLEAALGKRFINCGISEQAMVGMAAGLAKTGLLPVVYSIAPFCYARPFEQIRNDVHYHRLPVLLVGNGGGYAYGAMGPTHHALEDYGILQTLPDMALMAPCFNSDIAPLWEQFIIAGRPTYMRLGRDGFPVDFTPPDYAPLRQLLPGSNKDIVLAVGPIAHEAWEAIQAMPNNERPSLYVITELQATLPENFLRALHAAPRVFVVEEHRAEGGYGARLAHLCAQQGVSLKRLIQHSAKGYPSNRYGSQVFHRKESGLDTESLLRSFSFNKKEDIA